MPPAIGAHLPPIPPPGDEPRIHLGADAGLADFRCALQDVEGKAAKELQGLISIQAARDVSSGGAGISVGEGADESYAGPTEIESPTGTNGGGVKRDRKTTEDDQEEGSEDDEDDEEEGLLAYHPAASLALRNSCAETANDEDNAGTTTQGHLFVTTRRILFLSTVGSQHDAAIDAGCVILHALSECEERGWHVYCQLDDGSPGGGADDNETVMPDDAYVYPASDQGKDACQKLFDAFSALASLNPIYGDDDGDGGGGGFAGGGLFGLMAGMGEMMMGGDYGDDGEGKMGGEENADEMVCRLGEGINLTGGFGPATTDAEGGHANDDGATGEERAVMLERLDGMLVVPAEYEIASGDDEEGVENEHAGGQFDDAEESGDDLL